MPPWTKWLLGIIASLLVAGVIGVSATLASHGERLAITETRYQHLVEGQKEIKENVKRLVERLIEGKKK